MEKIKSKISKLTKELEQWNYEYYALDNPSVSDAVYDAAMRELIDLEKQYPEFKSPNSPTARVGGYVLDKFKKIKHLRLMLSLDNIFDKQGLIHFCDNIESVITDKLSYVIEPKIDGLSISIIYENCKLKYACTRGDGEYGEDVTNNVLTISSIPPYINEKYKDVVVEIRGEVYMSIDTLNKLNENATRKFANCRNAAAGALRNLDSSIAKSRNLQAYFYFVYGDKLNLENHIDAINWLRQNNFPVSNEICLVNNVNEIWNQIENFAKIRNQLNYETDGIVIKLNEKKYYDEIGYTSKFPKWAIAYKFPAEIMSTKLLSIIPTVGRTGKITYVANLVPISLDGSIISSASLHNKEYIIEKDIRINDYVNIYKAGDVIPYVNNVVMEKRTSECVKYEPITNCPSCNSVLINSEDDIDQFCPNKDCKERIIRNIEYFCSRDIMNIEGVSLSIVSKLYDHNIIKSVVDFYDLKNKKQQIFDANINIKEKLFNNIIASVEKSKHNSLERIIASFAIKGVGVTIAKILAKRFKHIDNLINASLDELISINIIGDKIASNIYNFFKDEANLKLIDSLKSHNICMEYFSSTPLNDQQRYLEVASSEENKRYHNKTFVITGSFDQSRDEIKNILEEFYNAKVSNSVTKKTNYLIAGKNGGSKLDKAKTLSIEVIENEFWK